jgi:hypothetical protein
MLATHALVVLVLEGGCAYSGCVERVPLIRAMVRDDCRTEVVAGEPDDLGPCRACARPFDVVAVLASYVRGRVVMSER